ncbi:MAG: MATE family efflux transporter [Tannerellaceae bacterium]|jgi:putative MATE family efflux protein|nr:MATE family efflux transporter [Tannerellaceae bacterium]
MYTNKQIWSVSYPIFLSLLAQNLINVTDTAFLGHVGEVELGASAMGGLFYICCFTVAFGFSTGSQIIIARRNGERLYGEVGPVMIQGVMFLLVIAAFMFGLSSCFAKDIMRFMISSDTIMDATLEFLDWRIFGFFFSFVNVMFRALFIGITRTKILTLNALVMAVTNIILDYLLIFGHAGFPQMGLKGAAIASVIAEAASSIFFLVYTKFTVDTAKYGLNHFRSFDFKLLHRVLGISIYTMLQYFISMSTFFMFFVAVERLGQKELAVANIARSIYIVMFIPVNSLSTTTNSFVSNTIGAGNINQVIPLINKISRLSFLIMTVFVAVICAFPETIISIYTADPSLVAASVPSLYVIAAAMMLSSVSSIFFSGVSGTGNTRPALAMELITLFFYCIYLYWVGMVLKMPVHICFTTELIYYVCLLALCFFYLKKAGWRNKKI